MKKKITGIFICIILIIAATLSVTADTLFEENEKTKEFEGFEICFFNARIDNLTEEIIDDTVYYTFHADYFRGFVFAFFPPIHLHFQRINDENINTGFPKKNFIGFAGENFIFGIVGGIVR